MSDKQVLIEQLGAPSASWGVARASDLFNKVLPGLSARRKVQTDDLGSYDMHETRAFVEQLGVPSGDYGLPKRKDLPAALLGAYVKWDVGKYWGYDYRRGLNELIEQRILPLPIEERKKTLLLTVLYEVARKLPGR